MKGIPLSRAAPLLLSFNFHSTSHSYRVSHSLVSYTCSLPYLFLLSLSLVFFGCLLSIEAALGHRRSSLLGFSSIRKWLETIVTCLEIIYYYSLISSLSLSLLLLCCCWGCTNTPPMHRPHACCR